MTYKLFIHFILFYLILLHIVHTFLTFVQLVCCVIKDEYHISEVHVV